MPGSTGAPSGSSTTGGTVSNKNADDHFAYVHWDEATLQPMKVVTPTAPGERVETPDEQLQRTIKVSKWNPALTLVYFHTPHEDLEKSKLVGAAGATLRQCKTFRDQEVLRWLSLYHCVEVDMGASDAATAERLGAKDGAIFAIVDQDLNVVATTKPIAASEGVASFLKSTLKSEKCAKFWAPIQSQLDEQKKSLEKARLLMTQEKWKEALELYQQVLSSNVMIADFWEDARKEATKAARKVDQAK